jgi:sorbitol-specific phosphotransferase system component IIBC
MAEENKTESSDQTTNVLKGVAVGGLATVAVVAAAPVLLPLVGLGAVATAVVGVGTALPWIGAGIGGWLGYNKK